MPTIVRPDVFRLHVRVMLRPYYNDVRTMSERCENQVATVLESC